MHNETGLEVAVIGMAGRFPGAVDIDTFWENLKNGVESISFFSPSEMKEEGVDGPLAENPSYVGVRGLLGGVWNFDNDFFGYSGPEAAIMDPQHRIFHEVVWGALESAGYEPGTHRGKIGLYAGASPNFYWETFSILVDGISPEGIPDTFSDSQLVRRDYLTTRISFALDLRGPSFLVQTACSTSLTAVHLACQGLLSGECDLALAGGVSVAIPQKMGYLYREGMIMSPDGHCRAFDDESRGLAGGDGAGVVVLKLLDDARRDGDHILAIIKGTGINNDGNQKSGFTAPSVKAQANLVRGVLALAEVEPESIGCIEAHGTGTPLGDPIEIRALTRAFDTDKRGYCRIGSVKTNIGHLDAAAGIAGFIKAVLMVKHGQIAPSLHYRTPNRQIDFENSPFVVNTRLHQWQAGDYPRRAGVSSFGVGGTNAHVIVEEYPGEYPGECTEACTPGTGNESREPRRHLLPLSARSAGALDELAQNLAQYLEDTKNREERFSLADVAHTLQVGRRSFRYRRILAVPTMEGAVKELRSKSGTATHRVPRETPRVVFMYAGQGGGEDARAAISLLYDRYPGFRDALDRCCPDPPALLNNGGAMAEAAAIFLLEYGMTALLKDWGIEPWAVVGYSLGDYTAACAAGVFTPETALEVVVRRAELMDRHRGGVMLSVPLPRETLSGLLSGDLAIAVDNGPSCIIAGPAAAVKDLEVRLKKQKLLCMIVNPDMVAHCRLMEPAAREFETHLAGVSLTAPKIPILSTLTGTWAEEGTVNRSRYWRDHLTRPLRFADALNTLVESPNIVMIDIGPNRDLGTLVKRFVENRPDRHLVSLLGGHGPVARLPERIARLWWYGLGIDWPAFGAAQNPNEKRYRVPLPTYPFGGRRFWADTRILHHLPWMVRDRTAPGQAPMIPTPVPEPVSKTNLGGYTAKNREELTDAPYRPPKTHLEKELARIWGNYFGVNPVGVEDDFFQLGGDSLKAMNLSLIMGRELGSEISVAEFFHHPTIRRLARHLGGGVVEAAPTAPVSTAPVPTEQKEYYPASSAQRRLYWLQQRLEGLTVYNESAVVMLEGRLDKDRLEEVFRHLVRRHESLRTSFWIMETEAEDQLVQRVHHHADFSLEYPEYPEPVEPDAVAETMEKMIHDFVRPFELTRPPLMRVGLARTGENRHLLVVDMHHTITDGVSQGLLIKEFTELYNGGRLPVPRLQYRDFAQWQNHPSRVRAMAEQEQYWLERFSGEIPVLDLPTDYERSGQMDFAGTRFYTRLDGETARLLRETAYRHDATLYMVLLAAFNLLLYRLTGSEDVVCGTVIAGRPHAELWNIVGMFVNTLALRNHPAAHLTFGEFLTNVRTNTLGALDNQEYPFESLVEKVVRNTPGAVPDNSRNPLFDVLFILQTKAGTDSDVTGLKVSQYPYAPSAAKFDLVLECVDEPGDADNPGGIDMVFQYRTSLFKEETIQRFAEYFKGILTQTARDPGLRPGEIDIMPEEEKQVYLNRIHRPRTKGAGENMTGENMAVTGSQRPLDPREEKLAFMWSDVLKLDRGYLEPGSNFFRMGGHSLNATLLLSRLRKEFDVDIKLATLFSHPTLEEMAVLVGGDPRPKAVRNQPPTTAAILTPSAPPPPPSPPPSPVQNKKHYVAIESANQRPHYPTSSAQKRLYALQHMVPGVTAYNMPMILRLRGQVEKGRLENSFRQLVWRHESLRTSFYMEDDRPVQQIHDDVPFKIEYQRESQRDCPQGGENTCDPGDRINALAADFVRAFDLSRAPLLRVKLVEMEEQDHLLLVDMHHIVSDGVSMVILISEFTALYGGRSLPPVKLHYKDYCLWKLTGPGRVGAQEREAYWLREFSGEIPVIQWPVPGVRPAVQDFRGRVEHFEIEPGQTAGLDRLARDNNLTLFMVLLGIYNLFLHKITGSNDLIVGTVVAGRNHADLESVMGMFVNTLPLRHFPRGEQPFVQFLEEIKKRTLDAFENQDYPFEELVEKVEVQREPGRTPLFDTLFTLGTIDYPPLEIPGLELTPVETGHHIAKFDLTFSCSRGDDRIYCGLEYADALFGVDDIRRFIGYIKTAAMAVATSPDTRIGDIRVISDQELGQVLYEFNRTRAHCPAGKTIEQLFGEQAARCPDRTALVDEGKEDTAGGGACRQMSYRAVSDMVGRWAEEMKEWGIGPGTIVAIEAVRRVEIVMTMLAIWKTGGIYLPLDPAQPETRKEYMLRDSRARLALLPPAARGGGEPPRPLCTEGPPLDPPEKLFSKSGFDLGGVDGGYVIYTSGSTGRPRGVLVGRRSVLNFVTWIGRYYALTGGDRVAQYTPLTFDASVIELYPPLLNGSGLYIVPDAIKLQVDKLREFYLRHCITVAFLPTPMAESYMEQEDGPPCLRALLTGGDRLRTFRGRPYTLYNNYGPTETTVVVIACAVTEASPSIPIGTPIANTMAYILDSQYQPCPVGVIGELIISGTCLAHGYLNNPEQTADKFIPSPIAGPIAGPGRASPWPPEGRRGPRGASKAYKTGDMARWLHSGVIEFLGRRDHQVKIRGVRIELGEIEALAASLEGVRSAAVLSLQDNRGDTFLCLYIVPDRQGDFSEDRIRERLAGQLPRWMVPDHIMPVERIPLTAHGKIDSRSLPRPIFMEIGQTLAPRNEIEKKMRKIWSDVLGVEEGVLGMDSDFFRVGGHSLRAAVLISRIEQETGVQLPLVEIFKSPTIGQLARLVERALPGRVDGPEPGAGRENRNLVLMKKGNGKSPGLFLFHGGYGSVSGYMEFCGHMPDDLDCWGIRADYRTIGPVAAGIEETAALYVAQLRRAQPRGPYRLVGRCIGGTLAFEVALQLEQQGEIVEFLGLVNSPAPVPGMREQYPAFSLRQEIAWLGEYLPFLSELERQPDTEITETGPRALTRFWEQVVAYLEGTGDRGDRERLVGRLLGQLKGVITENESQVIPGYSELGIGEMIRYLNLGRSFSFARSRYVPRDVVYCPVHYFGGSRSEVENKSDWSNHVHRGVIFHEVEGDNYSIFTEPVVEGFSGLVAGLLDH